ncbi:MAG: energy transducer TonB [Flavisolibacter sp.]
MQPKKLIALFALLLILSIASFHAHASEISAVDTLPDKNINDSTILDNLSKPDVEAKVDAISWRHHLEESLMPFIMDAAVNKMKPGTYNVQVRFVVEEDGSVSNVKALNDPGFGLAEGAVKTVKAGPKWTPAELKGKKIRSYHTQPITFMISNPD